MTACQPLTARTDQICTQFCISQFLNSLGKISTEGQKNNNNFRPTLGTEYQG